MVGFLQEEVEGGEAGSSGGKVLPGIFLGAQGTGCQIKA